MKKKIHFHKNKYPTGVGRQAVILITTATFVILFGLSAAVSLTLRVEQREHQVSREKSQVSTITAFLEGQLLGYESMLYSIKGFYEGSVFVDRKEFQSFVETLELHERFDGIQALEYILKVTDEEKEAYISSVRNDTTVSSQGYPDFFISPEGERDEYYVVNYIEPLEGNEVAFGFDLKSNPERRVALELARDEDRIIVTAPIDLVQGSAEEPGFLIFLPIYKKGFDISTVALRREAIEGFALAVFNAEDMIGSIIADEESSRHFYIQVIDSTDGLNEPLAEFNVQGSTPLNGTEEYVEEIRIGERTWTVKFVPLDTFIPQQQYQELWKIAFLFLIVLSVSATLIVYFLLSTRARALYIAEELMEELEQKTREIADLAKFPSENVNPVLRIARSGEILYTNIAGKKVLKLWKSKVGSIAPKNIQALIGDTNEDIKPFSLDVIVENKIFSLLFTSVGGEEYVNVYGRDVSKEREVSRLKSDFVSTASHQLQTPLSGIKWFSELLLRNDETLSPEDRQDFVSQIYVSNERLIALVHNLLDVSRIESGEGFEMNRELTNISELVQRVMKDINIFAKEKNMQIHDDLESIKDIEILIDAEKMTHAFRNLLDNAIRYSEKGTTIEVGGKRTSDGVEIYVRDKGIGIPKEEQHRIFGRFFRANNAVLHEPQGSGLGLWIVKSIVEMHNGIIRFKSDEGKGTTFYVSFPINR